MKPFSVHTALSEQYEAFIGGGNPLGLATLTFTTLVPNIVVPVTHTEFVEDFTLEFGKSSTSMVERVEFRASFFSPAILPLISKGLKCSLIIAGTIPLKRMQLWHGGLEAGGERFRFMLVSENYRG